MKIYCLASMKLVNGLALRDCDSTVPLTFRAPASPSMAKFFSTPCATKPNTVAG